MGGVVGEARLVMVRLRVKVRVRVRWAAWSVRHACMATLG